MPLTEEEKKKRKQGNVKCNRCDKGIYRPPSKLKRSKVFYCSPNCHKLALKECVTEEERKEATRQTKLKYARSVKGIAKNKELYLTKRPELLEYKKEWWKKNAAHCREVCKKYYEDNKDSISDKSKVYYLLNKVVINEKQRKYYAKNAERFRQVSREWYIENKEMADANSRAWAVNNRERIRVLSKEMRDGLRDCYIRGLFTRRSILTAQDIPQSLIDAKRIEVQMKRYFKEQGNG